MRKVDIQYLSDSRRFMLTFMEVAREPGCDAHWADIGTRAYTDYELVQRHAYAWMVSGDLPDVDLDTVTATAKQ